LLEVQRCCCLKCSLLASCANGLGPGGHVGQQETDHVVLDDRPPELLLLLAYIARRRVERCLDGLVAAPVEAGEAAVVG